MNNTDYIYEGWDSKVLLEALADPNVNLLVREIHHTFKLKAYSHTDTKRICMCNDQGLPVCYLWVRKNDEDAIEYCYQSPFYSKQRGRNDEARRTVFSTKLSVLITTLKRNECVPTIEKVTGEIFDNLNYGIEQIKNTMCKTDKNNYDIDTESVHTMLKIVFDQASPSELAKHNREKLQKVLEKWNSADQQKKESQEIVETNFNNGFYAIGVYPSGYYFVGVIKRHMENNRMKCELVTPFKRVKELMGETELIPILTMIKVSMNNESTRGKDVQLPDTLDKYDPNLGVSYRSPSKRGLLNYALTLIPCSLV